MDPATRNNLAADASAFTPHSVKALAAQHDTLLRQARQDASALDDVLGEQQAQLAAHMASLGDEDRRRFTELYGNEMAASAEKLLAEAAELREKRAIREQPRANTADRAATWFFIILILVFIAIASKT